MRDANICDNQLIFDKLRIDTSYSFMQIYSFTVIVAMRTNTHDRRLLKKDQRLSNSTIGKLNMHCNITVIILSMLIGHMLCHVLKIPKGSKC